MGILDQLLGNHQERLLEGWQSLAEEQQIEEVLAASQEKPILIFKHSPHCGISAMVKHQVERDWEFSEEELSVFYVDVIHSRPTSRALAERLGVVHQSPQVILIHKEKVVYATSHHMISVKALKEALNELA